ncbi:hypothetical protein ScPMuIL_003509 [Solemya velum]
MSRKTDDVRDDAKVDSVMSKLRLCPRARYVSIVVHLPYSEYKLSSDQSIFLDRAPVLAHLIVWDGANIRVLDARFVAAGGAEDLSPVLRVPSINPPVQGLAACVPTDATENDPGRVQLCLLYSQSIYVRRVFPRASVSQRSIPERDHNFHDAFLPYILVDQND